MTTAPPLTPLMTTALIALWFDLDFAINVGTGRIEYMLAWGTPEAPGYWRICRNPTR